MTTSIAETPTQQIAQDLLDDGDRLESMVPSDAPPLQRDHVRYSVSIGKGVARLLKNGEQQDERSNSDASAILQGVASLFRNPKILHAIAYAALGATTLWSTLRTPTAPATPVATKAQQTISADKLARVESLLTNIAAHIQDAQP